MHVAAHAILSVGYPLIVDASSPTAQCGVVFEDDGATGYFYALELSQERQRVVDALHVYTVSQVVDRDVPSKIEIIWSSDGLHAALLINSHPKAIFDFAAHRGYCRLESPIPASGWTHSHVWDDDVWIRMQWQA